MMKLIQTFSKMYDISISDPEAPYFNVTLVSKNIQILSEEVIKFTNTSMGRSMIVVKVILNILFYKKKI